MIIGGHFSIEELSNIIGIPWLLQQEIEALNSFDIGIMPMPDDAWTNGKCGFKAILYMSMAIPTICSPVGVNKEIINDGVNGFFAQTEKDWVDRIALLIEDPQLRERIGFTGRKTVEEKYSVKVNASKFLSVIQRVYDERYKHEKI